MWWLLAPVSAWGVKKVYDYATKPSDEDIQKAMSDEFQEAQRKRLREKKSAEITSDFNEELSAVLAKHKHLVCSTRVNEGKHLNFYNIKKGIDIGLSSAFGGMPFIFDIASVLATSADSENGKTIKTEAIFPKGNDFSAISYWVNDLQFSDTARALDSTAVQLQAETKLLEQLKRTLKQEVAGDEYTK